MTHLGHPGEQEQGRVCVLGGGVALEGVPEICRRTAEVGGGGETCGGCREGGRRMGAAAILVQCTPSLNETWGPVGCASGRRVVGHGGDNDVPMGG